MSRIHDMQCKRSHQDMRDQRWKATFVHDAGCRCASDDQRIQSLEVVVEGPGIGHFVVGYVYPINLATRKQDHL